MAAGVGVVWTKNNFKNIPWAGQIYDDGGWADSRVTDTPTDNYKSFAINAGIGFKYFITENVALCVEALDTYAHEIASFGRVNGSPSTTTYPSQVV